MVKLLFIIRHILQFVNTYGEILLDFFHTIGRKGEVKKASYRFCCTNCEKKTSFFNYFFKKGIDK